MQQAASQAQQGRKKSMIVAGIGAAFVSAGITFAVMGGAPASPMPAQAAAPAARACQAEPLIELASVENGGGGVIRFREGDFVSQPIKLSGSAQPVVFPKLRPETAPLKETITIEGDATNVVLGADGDHFVVPRVDGSYSYTMTWLPAKKC